MKIAAFKSYLETIAPPSLQESYDNAGLLTGSGDWECSGVILALDATEEVIDEAVEKKCNLVVTHHPIVFKGLKCLNGNNYIERAIIRAIKNDIAIYAIHTNLDNVITGVNGKIAERLGLKNVRVLQQKEGQLRKLVTFAPAEHAEGVRSAIFAAGGGSIGKYSECSFNQDGIGTFKPGLGSSPFIGELGKRSEEQEVKIEVIFPSHLQHKLITAMKEVHPYDEVAYDIIPLANDHQGVGSGIIGELPEPIEEGPLLQQIKKTFDLKVIRHTPLLSKKVQKIAICGGAGSFLLPVAISQNADVYITSDVKYHEFFDADSRILLADIGHYESEQFTIDLLYDLLTEKFPTFAVQKTGIKTNPVHYFL
jgi:dinuclear metal center YbgI/SA1388 family protein